MKTMKRIAVVALAVAMLFALGIPAMAAGETYSITINNETKGHTYEAYQIFTGDISDAANQDGSAGTNAVLSNIQWGSGLANGPDIVVTYGVTSAAEIAELISNGYTPGPGEHAAIPLSEFIAALQLTDVKATSGAQTEGKYIIGNLAPGYYLVKDKDASVQGQNDAMTEFILEVVENSTVSPKSSVPTIEKKVTDTNDTTGDPSGWQDSADYDIGDFIQYKIMIQLPNNLESYDSYHLKVTDTISKGLTFGNIDRADFGPGLEGSLLSGTDFTVTKVTNEDGSTTVTVDFPDLKRSGAKNGDKIQLIYQAELNNNAVIGAAGNPNTVSMEYSNNPNGEGEGQSPEDKVTIFTYQLAVDKTDEKGEALTGAEFTLYKSIAGSREEYTQVGRPISGADTTHFVWTGLDDGDYKLVESKTPVGYNTIEPLLFTITAEHDVESADPRLNSLSGDTFTGEVSTGTLTATVVNKAGSTLPETGGMGVTPLYILGGAILLAAVVVIVERKRAKA